jgi:hypothetical protein
MREEDSEATAPSWSSTPSTKDKNAVQRSVTALLDELAPERVLKRADQPRLIVEQHRTPSGCVLQGPTAAVSVSWFAGAANDTDLGELHLVVWRGIVSRRGSPPTRERATIISETVLRPIPRPTDERVWQAADGTEYDTPSLVAYSLGLLDEQMRDESSAAALK